LNQLYPLLEIHVFAYLSGRFGFRVRRPDGIVFARGDFVDFDAVVRGRGSERGGWQLGRSHDPSSSSSLQKRRRRRRRRLVRVRARAQKREERDERSAFLMEAAARVLRKKEKRRRVVKVV